MRDFYASTGSMPLDQADGLRRMFAGARARCLIPLAANPHVPYAGAVIGRLTQVLSAAGRRTLVVDAADSAPAPSELARLDLASVVEVLDPAVSYLAARGLPLAFVDTHGSAARLIDAVLDAAPQVDVVLVHAGATDLARIFARRAVRPVLIAADDPDSVKHAYASVKLLALRARLRTFDTVLVADPANRRVARIAMSLAGCADAFLGCAMRAWAAVDPCAELQAPPRDDLTRLVAGQLTLDLMPSHPSDVAPHGQGEPVSAGRALAIRAPHPPHTTGCC